MIISQGFIASDDAGDTVLLGWGGSDISAAIVAVKCGATVCEIWTDVPGVYTANPHQIPQARLLRQLDYEEAQEIAAMTPICAGIRRNGSAALDLAWVAAGRFDGFWERDLKAWDIAAGMILVREAGGVTTEIDGGNALLTGSVISANADLHPKLEKQIRKAPSFARDTD